MRVIVPDKIINSAKYRSRKLYVYRDNRIIYEKDITSSAEEIPFDYEDVDSVRFELIDNARKVLNVFLNPEKIEQPFKEYIVKGNLQNLEETLVELDERYSQTQKLSSTSLGDKHLIYYTAYGKEYLDLFLNSIKSIFPAKPNHIDILLITDLETLSYLDESRELKIFITSPQNKYLARFYIAQYLRTSNYNKVLYLDSDTLVSSDIFNLFNEKGNANLWSLAASEELGPENKASVYYGLKPLDECKKKRLLTNASLPFNSGQFMFVCSEQNLAHIENILWLSKNWNGEHFQDQSFINYYLNYYELGEFTLLTKYVNVVNNVQSFQQPDKTVLHFAKGLGNPELKKSVLLREKKKVDFILVSHNSKINGASHSLYILGNFLKSEGKQVLVLDVVPNTEIINKYNLEAADFEHYHNDAAALYFHITQTEYSKIIFNSINPAYREMWDLIDQNKVIRFSREIASDYLRSAGRTPDFVITREIAESYGEVTPQVQTPILPRFLLDKMDEAPAYNFNTDKIVIGMSGMVCNRKNYNLFLETAKQLKQYYFAWIGGEGEDQGNLMHIPATSNPYSYYKGLDYFALFSEYEPFGNVVIENLYLGNKVLTFRDNIFYRHIINEIYFEYPGKICLNTAKEHILNHCTEKKAISAITGREYIEKNFLNYNQAFIDKLYAGCTKI